MDAGSQTAVTTGLRGDERFADGVLEFQVAPDTEPGCEALVGQVTDARVACLAMPLSARCQDR